MINKGMINKWNKKGGKLQVHTRHRFVIIFDALLYTINATDKKGFFRGEQQ